MARTPSPTPTATRATMLAPHTAERPPVKSIFGPAAPNPI
jgi:hypothetical protein